VEESAVLIDRTRRRALVRAKRLDGAPLAAYRTLEARIAATEPDWTVELIPPEAALPAEIGFDADGPNEQGRAALAVVAWGAQRLGRRIVLVGDADRAEQAAQALRADDVEVEVRPASGPVRPLWAEAR
jgi:hypothetical protein